MSGSDLAEFLRARLGELEMAANTATKTSGGARWGVEFGGDVVLEPLPAPVSVTPDEMVIVAPMVAELNGAGWHVAMHSPARVLADIDAKRDLIDQCLIWQRDTAHHPPPRYVATVAMMVLCLLARPWADHEDYDPDWEPM